MKYITSEDRYKIEELWRSGASRTEIAMFTGLSHATVCRELKRGYDGTSLDANRCGYSAEIAIKSAAEGEARKDEGRRKPRDRRIIRRSNPSIRKMG